MHSSCVLRKTSPEWVVYQELYETNKIYMRNVTAIEPEWLPKFAPTLCNLSEPLIDPPPRYSYHNCYFVFLSLLGIYKNILIIYWLHYYRILYIFYSIFTIISIMILPVVETLYFKTSKLFHSTESLFDFLILL